ncbi:MAG TPA: hypothetical protein VMN57_09900 [Anaerolineales bacterium]|nr:hypothetical protein [Anaerolineales bacterium]
MRTARTFLGALLVLTGAIFFFQGIGVLPGSFMTGQIQWAVYGALAVGAGGVLLYFNRKKEK